MERTQHIHEGRNIKRFMEILGMKQEALAFELGEDWTQKKVSQLEDKMGDLYERMLQQQKEMIEKLEKILISKG